MGVKSNMPITRSCFLILGQLFIISILCGCKQGNNNEAKVNEKEQEASFLYDIISTEVIHEQSASILVIQVNVTNITDSTCMFIPTVDMTAYQNGISLQNNYPDRYEIPRIVKLKPGAVTESLFSYELVSENDPVEVEIDSQYGTLGEGFRSTIKLG